MSRFILALDQGTTSSRAIVFDRAGSIKAIAQQEFPQIFPQSGWVEHDPEEIWSSQKQVVIDALAQANLRAEDIAALGITNQRETTIVWDRDTGQAIANGIVWQDRRTASLCAALRDDGNETPVLLLTARGQASDRIEGLRLGADDYLPKPFEPEELALRTSAILKRTHVPPPPTEIEMSGLVFEPAKGLLTGPSGNIRLTDSEHQLLTILSKNPGEPVSREALAAQTSNGTERSIDVQVTRLRKKIEPDPRNPIHIQTVRGIGYRLMPD